MIQGLVYPSHVDVVDLDLRERVLGRGIEI